MSKSIIISDKEFIVKKLYQEKRELQVRADNIYNLLLDIEKQRKLKLDSMDMFYLDTQLQIIRSYISILETRICYIQYYKGGSNNEKED